MKTREYVTDKQGQPLGYIDKEEGKYFAQPVPIQCGDYIYANYMLAVITTVKRNAISWIKKAHK